MKKVSRLLFLLPILILAVSCASVSDKKYSKKEAMDSFEENVFAQPARFQRYERR